VIFAAVLVLSQAGGAWASGRPAECTSLDGGRGANVWERAKAPELRRYCDLLAAGAAKLAWSAARVPLGAPAPLTRVPPETTSREVLEIADDAERAMPGRAGPELLRGRALALVGKWPEARKALGAAKAKDERALDDPQSLLSWGRVLARTGSPLEAQEAYRALLPRAAVLASSERGAAGVEAGLLAMGRGPSGLDEAIAILRQARRDAQDALQSFAVMALALALDRAGDADEARAVLAERVHADPRPVLADPRVKDALATAGSPIEGRAAAALALGTVDVRAAAAEWKAIAEAGAGPWTAHARAHAQQQGPAKPAPRGEK
jgi:tetratricopeptide (TPR) repeat protein